MLTYHRAPLARMLPAVLAVVLAACGGAAPGPTTLPASSAAGTPQPSGVHPAASPAAPATAAPLPDNVPHATLDVTVAEILAAGEITPEHGGTVSATTADGATWTLVVGPWAVRTPVTVTLRPLSGDSALGRVVAGIDLAPAGLRLAEPATLTVTGIAVPPAVVALEYRGEAPGADAGLVIGPGTAAGTGDGTGSLAFSVAHFSGNVAVDVGSDANTLYEKWSASRGGDTPEGRQAAAETRYAAAELARKSGRVSAETAADIQNRAMVEWLAAEADRLATNPELTRLAESGDPRDLDVIDEELGRILQVEHQLALIENDLPTDGLAKVVETLQAYEAAIIEKVFDSQRIQDAAASGRVSDMGEVIDTIGIVLTLERRLALLGANGAEVMAKVIKLLEKLRTGLLASCANAPLDPAIVLGLERTVLLLGGAAGASLADILKCTDEPTPTPLTRTGWLVEASNTILAGSATLCGDDEAIMNPTTGDLGVFVEVNGGMPEDWPPDKVYEIQDGIRLDFAAALYDLYVARGTGRNATIYEFDGRLTLRLDASGRLMGGSGAGKGRILFPTGEVKNNVPDTLTFTVTAVREPTWCTETPSP